MPAGIGHLKERVGIKLSASARDELGGRRWLRGERADVPPPRPIWRASMRPRPFTNACCDGIGAPAAVPTA